MYPYKHALRPSTQSTVLLHPTQNSKWNNFELNPDRNLNRLVKYYLFVGGRDGHGSVRIGHRFGSNFFEPEPEPLMTDSDSVPVRAHQS